MPKLDRAFAGDAVARLEALPADAKPLWGELTRDGVISHLAGAFEYSMGRIEPLPPQTGLPFPRLVGWLLVNVFFPIPKHVKFKGNDGEVLPAIQTEGGIERLRELMEEFIVLIEKGEKPQGEHPLFGTFTQNQWLKFHGLHLSHHLKQFEA